MKFKNLVQILDHDLIEKLTDSYKYSVHITLFGLLNLKNISNIGTINIERNRIIHGCTIISQELGVTIGIDLHYVVSIRPVDKFIMGKNLEIVMSFKEVRIIDSELRIHNSEYSPLFINPKVKQITINSFILDTIVSTDYTLNKEIVEESGLNYINVPNENKIVIEHGNILSLPMIAKSKKLKI